VVLIAKRICNSFGHLDLTFTSLPTNCRNGSLKGFAGLGRQGAAHYATLTNLFQQKTITKRDGSIARKIRSI
jgi:hypothetical protein